MPKAVQFARISLASTGATCTISERIPIAAVLDQLSVSEMKALLQRVTEGDGSRVVSELQGLTYPPMETAAHNLISCVNFATEVIEARVARLKAEAIAVVAEQKRAAAIRCQITKSQHYTKEFFTALLENTKLLSTAVRLSENSI